jgi:hypothetical protein
MEKIYKIEKNIPIPLGRVKSILPLDEMEIGDSFIVGSYSKTLQRKFSSLILNYNRSVPQKKFICVKHFDNLRVWRIDDISGEALEKRMLSIKKYREYTKNVYLNKKLNK